MRKLLVPFDKSPCAERALGHAIEVARTMGETQIVVVAVHEAVMCYGRSLAGRHNDDMARELDEGSHDCLRPALCMLSETGVPFSREILAGDVPETIARRADELGCDAIVMGTRGMGAVGNLMMGSVAQKVVHLSDIPVTLVK